MHASRPMLFLVVDAIPFDLARGLWRDGGMPGFAEPRPMVSVFPSLTHVAVPALVRGVTHLRPHGYESRYVHPPTWTVRGGIVDDASPMDVYRMRPRTSVDEVAIYLFAETLSFGQARWVRWRFNQERGAWLGYLSATDGVAHFEGREALREALADIFGQVDRLRDRFEAEEGVRPGAVLCSDHGFRFQPLQATEVERIEKHLELAGFRPGGPLPEGVLMAPVGEVGGGAAWCAPERAAEAARAIAEVPGVDVAFGRKGDGCEVFAVRSGLERARIDWEAGRTRYEAVDGDPLGYAAFQGWIDDDALLAATWDHPYPYAPPRLREGFTDLVEHPAQVLFSMADGFAVSPTLTHVAARLRGGQVGTHGSLGRDQSLGFAVSTEDRWRPGPLRPREVFEPWADMLRRRHPG